MDNTHIRRQVHTIAYNMTISKNYHGILRSRDTCSFDAKPQNYCIYFSWIAYRETRSNGFQSFDFEAIEINRIRTIHDSS